MFWDVVVSRVPEAENQKPDPIKFWTTRPELENPNFCQTRPYPNPKLDYPNKPESQKCQFFILKTRNPTRTQQILPNPTLPELENPSFAKPDPNPKSYYPKVPETRKITTRLITIGVVISLF